MSIAMWGKALTTIPRIDKEEWDQLDIVARWLIATRSAVLVMTFISSALAGIFAYRDGQFDLWLWVVLTIGLLMAHATNNLINDLTDHLKGTDKDNTFRSQYGPQPLEHGLMSMRQVLTYTAITGVVALLAGLYLVSVRGSGVLVLLGVGVFFVLFYTYPLKYIGLGELAVLVVWGPLMVGGGYYVLTGTWDWLVALASLPYALGTTTVIFGKHIDKLGMDRSKRVLTLPVLLGERAARYSVLAMAALQYGLVLYLVLTGFFSPVMLVVLLALHPFFYMVAAYTKPRPEAMPDNYRADIWPLWFVAVAFWHNRNFGIFFLLGLLVDLVLRATIWPT
jgi:1,4-dihydroxy-2-naphthoate octaprenyltransferase